MVIYSSGLLESGWVFSLLVFCCWVDEGYVEGIFYDVYFYFVLVDCCFGDIGFLNFIVFGVFIKWGKIFGVIQEVYDLVGMNYYNVNWGFQNGKVCNLCVQDIYQLVFMLCNDFDLLDKFKFLIIVGY